MRQRDLAFRESGWHCAWPPKSVIDWVDRLSAVQHGGTSITASNVAGRPKIVRSLAVEAAGLSARPTATRE
jgi:hypothetical protein